MHIAVLFHNIGGYHAARLRAAQEAFFERGWRLTAIQETESTNEHPWGNLNQEITFPLKTLVETASSLKKTKNSQSAYLRKNAAKHVPDCLTALQPDIIALPGWSSLASKIALKWAVRNQIPAILMSESKWNDDNRVWIKEKIKSVFYVKKFKSSLVGGSLHRDYLKRLNFSNEAIFEGYDVVDNDYFQRKSKHARSNRIATLKQFPEIPHRPYFIAVSRCIPRENILG